MVLEKAEIASTESMLLKSLSILAGHVVPFEDFRLATIALYGQLSHSLLDVGAQRMSYIYCTIWTGISQSPRRWGTKDEIYIYILHCIDSYLTVS